MTEESPNLPTNDQEKLIPLRQNLLAVETMIGHELSLIGNRVIWFAISQSFLFGAYATIATDPTRNTIYEATDTTRQFGEFTIKLVLFMVPVVGALFAFAARRSVAAAGRVLDELMTSRGSLLTSINTELNQYSIPDLPVVGDAEQRPKSLRSTIRDGELPLWLLPWGMGIVWVLMLFIRLPLQQWLERLGPP
jgi:hypothetical protein